MMEEHATGNRLREMHGLRNCDAHCPLDVILFDEETKVPAVKYRMSAGTVARAGLTARLRQSQSASGRKCCTFKARQWATTLLQRSFALSTKRAFDEISGEIKRLISRAFSSRGTDYRLRLIWQTSLEWGGNHPRGLRLLELSGFISMQKGGAGGPLVVDTILNTIGNSFLDAFQMGRITIDELTVARLAIEQMVWRASLDLYRADLRALRENVSQAKKKIESGTQAFEENTQFHRLLARSLRPPVRYPHGIYHDGSCPFSQHPGVNLELSDGSVTAHEQIIAALEEGNREKALAFSKHISWKSASDSGAW